MIGMALIPPKKKTTSVGKDAEKRNASSPGGSRGNGRAPPQKGDVTRQVHSGSAPADLSAGARAGNCTTLSAARLTAATGEATRAAVAGRPATHTAACSCHGTDTVSRARAGLTRATTGVNPERPAARGGRQAQEDACRASPLSRGP